MRRTAWLLGLLLALGVLATPADAQLSLPIPLQLSVSGNHVSATIDLPGIHADLALDFENATGLTSQSLVASVRLLSPFEIIRLRRLPSFGAGVALGFPVVIRIDPAPGSAMSFEGAYGFGLHIETLDFVPQTPLALYSGPDGGDLRDITSFLGPGSVRAGGTKGSFSDFMIVVDVRAIDTIIGEKFAFLQTTLNQNAPALSPTVLASLQGYISRAKIDWQTAADPAALAEMDAFLAYVVAGSGSTIPDVWSVAGPANAAGLLRSAGETLRFSLSRKVTGLP